MEDYENLTFGQAIEALKNQNKISRSGWNGKGMYVVLAGCTQDPLYSRTAPVQEVPIEDFMAIRTVTGQYNTWVPSVSDVLANDWQIIQGGNL